MFADHLIDLIVVLVHDNGPLNRRLTEQFLEAFEEDRKSAPSNLDPELVTFYLGIIKTLVRETFDIADQSTVNRFLLKLKSDKALQKRREVYDLLKGIFDQRETLSMDQYKEHVECVRGLLISHRVGKVLRGAYSNYSKAVEAGNSRDSAEYLTKVFSIQEELGGIFKEVSATTGGLVSNNVVDMTDPDAVSCALERHEQRTELGVLKFGQQGLNRALGKSGGVAIGRFMNVSALPHHFKSGLLLSIAGWIIHYNDPPAFLPGKKVVLVISMENETEENVAWLYENIYLRTTGSLPPRGWTKRQIGEWVAQYLHERGWILRIHRYQPIEFGYNTFIRLIEDYEASGYSIVAAIIDYLQLSQGNSPGASNAARDVVMEVLFSNFRNYMSNKSITGFTAHPLNREAQKLAGLHTKVVSRFGAEHQADTMGVDRKVDIQIFMHIEYNHLGKAFLTFNLTKNRYVNDTPKAHKTFALPLVEGLGLIDDFGKTPTYVTNIYEAEFGGDVGENDMATVAASSVF